MSTYIRRREFLRSGALTLGGLTLGDLLRGRVSASGRVAGGSFGRAKACILLFMSGGPSHLDTWDPKPDAPDGIRGEYNPIQTTIPGVQICEHFPGLAKLASRYAIIRSLAHNDPNHGSGDHNMLTGRPAASKSKQWPTYGAVLARLGAGKPELPPFVRLRPFSAGAPTSLALTAMGADAGWLQQTYAPFSLDGDLRNPAYGVGSVSLHPNLSPRRLDERRLLLQSIHAQTETLKENIAVASNSALQERAFQFLLSRGACDAFDVSQEPDKVRDRYGRNLHGHTVLMARRLVEAGVPLVTVFYQSDPVGGEDSLSWDTHGGNFILLKNELMPYADRAFTALLEDLETRGMLDETLVVWTGEFGREPKISEPGTGNKKHWGRNHWAKCFSGVLAGGGVRGGQAYGASDRIGAYPKDRPVSPADLAATIYHCLGVRPDMELRDAQGQPHQLCTGQVIRELLS